MTLFSPLNPRLIRPLSRAPAIRVDALRAAGSVFGRVRRDTESMTPDLLKELAAAFTAGATLIGARTGPLQLLRGWRK